MINLPAAEVERLSVSDVVSPYIGVFFVAWLVTILITPLMYRFAIRKGIVDSPDQDRKKHREPVAYLGGVAIFLGWLAGVSLYLWISQHLPASLQITHFDFPITIIFGAVIITVTGLFDDVRGISPRVKIGGQLIAAAMVAHTDLGTRLVWDTFDSLELTHIPMIEHWLSMQYGLGYWLGMVVVAVFIIGGCNSVNLLDGLDGLATGVLSIATLGFLVIASFIAIELTDPTAPPTDRLSNGVRVVMCLAILGALQGFLPHNFNPANIFMGDTGSLLMGYLCATTILMFAHAPNAGPAMVSAALIVFALPIMDTSLAIFRRVMARQSIVGGDNRHLHHLMLNAFREMGFGVNLSVKLAVVTMYILASVFAVLGCTLLFYTRWRFVLAVLVVLFGFVMVAGYKSGQRHARLAKVDVDDESKSELATPRAGACSDS